MAGVCALASADDGGAVAWVVPTYKNARAPWRFAEAMVAPLGKRVRVNRTDRMIEFPASGGYLSIYSADNDVGLRGEAFDVVIVDEAAQIREETYTDVLMPTVADRAGRMFLISTPRGRNWFWREWVRGRDDGQESASWTAPSRANPMPTIQQAAERARELVSERTYRQEWLAEFIEDGGGVLRFVREAVQEMPAGPQGGRTYVAGLDWALSTDFTWLAIVDAETGQNVHNERFTGIDYRLQRERIAARCREWNLAIVVAESNAMGKPNNDELRALNLPVRDFVTTNTTKADIIENLAAAFENHRIGIPGDPVLIAELESIEATRLPSGAVRYAAPDGMHDDGPMALALAWSNLADRTPLIL